MLNNIKWLFFDVGSTLVDETECYNHRIRDAIAGTDITFEEFNEKRLYFSKQNLKGDIEALRYFGLAKTPWHHEDEKLYKDSENVLKILCEKGYRIGVIANQSAGTEKRLESCGLMKYIQLVVASAEEGVAKPDKRIFYIALKRAGCSPSEAVMIGDRVDNDIIPANEMGMMTIWVRQGFGKYWTISDESEKADFAVDSLSELLDIFR